jgi:hypothetical protein
MGLSLQAIAEQITRVGRGQAQAITAIPTGVSFPPDYQISRQACHKACCKALAREPVLGVEELRKIDQARCEEMIMNLQPAIRKGNPRAIEVAIKVLDHSAKINGYAVAQKHELTGKDGKELGGPNGFRIPLAVARAMLADLENQELTHDERPSGGDLDDDDDALPEIVTIEAARASLAEATRARLAKKGSADG